MAAGFEALGASHSRIDTSRNVGMRKTKTVDYILPLSGELDLLLDGGDVHLKPFDVVIQRGTNQAWVIVEPRRRCSSYSDRCRSDHIIRLWRRAKVARIKPTVSP